MATDSPKDIKQLQASMMEALASLHGGDKLSLEKIFGQFENLLQEEQNLNADLSQQLDLFKDLGDLLPGFVFTASRTGEIDYINKRWYEWSGSTVEENANYGWSNYIHDEDRAQFLHLWNQSMSSGKPFECECRLRRKDGVDQWYLVRGVPKVGSDNDVIRWFGCSVDIDEQRHFKDELTRRLDEISQAHAESETAKQQTAESELLFRTMCETSPELIWTADRKGNAIYFNAQFLQFSGQNWHELSNFGWFALVHPEEREQAVASWQEKVAQNSDFEIEIRMKRADGQYRWFLVRSLPIKDFSGQTLSWCGSCTDIETHRRLVSDLKNARDEAESALKVKSEFVANVSHELRTPLNGILGMVEVLLRGDLSQKSKEHVSTIREAGASLLSIINDILDFSKIEAGKMEMSRSQFNPLAVVEGVAEILVPQAAAKDLLLLATVDRAVPDTVYGDPLRLRQVLLNLCGNAIKFTDQGQIVLKAEVSVNGEGKSELLFSVFDSGIGISEHFQNRLFEPFMQDEGSAYRSTGGTGLGLSISKHLVELMGGKLVVDSKENIGSIFSFCLPLITEGDSDWTARAWENTYGRMKLLTLEPRHNNVSVICAHLCSLGIGAQSTDNPEYAVRILESTRNSPDRIQAICLDTIRYKQQSKDFLEAFKRSSVFGLISVIEIGTSESLTQARSTVVAPRTNYLAIPLRRKQVSACLDHLSGWRPKSKKPFSQTMEVDTIQPNSLSASISEHIERTGERLTTEKLTSNPQNNNLHDTDEPAAAMAGAGIVRRALVADDNKINQQVALLFLQDLGFVVDVTSDGIDAVSAFKKKQYDMVFLDCQMPGLDGFEACKIIKEIQQRRGLNVPVIAVTANAIAGSREDCLNRGMDDYLSKPIDPAAMSKLVARWLGVSDLKITFVPNQDSTPEDEEKRLPRVRKPVVDMRVLRSRFSERDMHTILQMFREACPQEILEIDDFAEKQDFIALKTKAHSFKGACSTICAPELTEICEKLEADCAVANFDLMSKHLVELRRHLVQAQVEIEHELLQHTTTTS